MAHDVFISHSSKDKPTADAVCATLEAHGIRCWIAPRDIESGESWPGAITRAIRESRVMVLVVSTNSNVSEQVSREVTQAAARGVMIIPLRVEPVQLNDDLAYYLDRVHWLDALTPPLERRLEELAVQVLRNLPERAPKFALLAPAAGDTIVAGEPLRVAWDGLPAGRDAPERLELALFRGAGQVATIGTVDARKPGAPAELIWSVPATLPAAPDYRVQVSAHYADGRVDTAQSTAPFAVTPAQRATPLTIRLLRPVGGERLAAGARLHVAWEVDFGVAHAPTNVSAVLIRGDSRTPLLDVPGPAEPGRTSRTTTLPGDLTPANDYRVSVTARNPAGGLAEAVSDAIAVVEPAVDRPGVVVTRPTKSSCLVAGSEVDVAWWVDPADAGKLAGFELELRRADGTLVAPLSPAGKSVAADRRSGRFTLPADAPVGGGYRVAVRGQIADGSEAPAESEPFTISATQRQVYRGRIVGAGLGLAAVLLTLLLATKPRGNIIDVVTWALSSAIGVGLMVGGPLMWAGGLVTAFPLARWVIPVLTLAGVAVALAVGGNVDQMLFTAWIGLVVGTGLSTFAEAASREARAPAKPKTPTKN